MQVHTILSVVAAYYAIQGCVNGELEVVRKNMTIRCAGLYSSQNMFWLVTPDNSWANATIIAACAFCPHGGPCPACTLLNTEFSVTRSGHFSDLRIVSGAHQKNGSRLICTKQDFATFDHCKIRVNNYNLPQCKLGTLEISEVQPETSILCEGLQSAENVIWMITNTTGSSVQPALCGTRSVDYACNVTNTDTFYASRNVSVSQLTITNSIRETLDNRTVACIRRDRSKSDSCRIRVVHPAETSNRMASLRGWDLIGTVHINKVYDSYNTISCSWALTGPLSPIILQTKPRLSETVVSDGKKYYTGTCNVSVGLSASEGLYQLSVTVLPGGASLLVGNVSVEKPGTPLLEAQTCPVIVAEGSSLECKCHHADTEQGSPPAFVSWLKDDNSSVLNISNVNKGLNGTDYTCRSVWGPTAALTQIVNYTLLVAYGPTSANVTSQKNLAYITETLTLTCTSDEVYPSANFSWSVPCVTLNLTSLVSTCEVSTGTLIQVTEVTCTAYNSEIPSLTTSAAYTPPAASE
ncbi:uncharacterized protein [Littorina saxatilis]|uniref:uncharacterized protein n=1 Tax=Littorina saxatilis TaxID=31220 RepID=UPI0038B55EBC